MTDATTDSTPVDLGGLGPIGFIGVGRMGAGMWRCLRAAGSLRPELVWRFAALGPDRARFAATEDVQFMNLRDLLPTLNEELP